MIRHRLLNRRTLAGVVLAMVTIILAAACGTATGEAEPTQPQNRTETIQVYYGNADGTELVQAEKTIIFQDESDKYKAALEQMRETKQNELQKNCRTSHPCRAIARLRAMSAEALKPN